MPRMPLAISLDPLEARVLGVLIEKEFTTPEQYPLSLNALVNGCNQKSNRDPEMAVSEHEIAQAILRLRVAQLVDFVQLAGQRVEKYRHRAGGTLHLAPLEQAVLAELLVRGAQQPNELARRVERMQPAATPESVQGALDALLGRQLVVQQPRRSGERYPRWEQLLAPAAGGGHAGSSERAARPDAGPDAARITAEIAAGHAHALPHGSAPRTVSVTAGQGPAGSWAGAPSSAVPAGGAPSGANDLAPRVAALEAEVSALREELRALAARLAGH
jgi:uncharacterized protein